MTVINAVNEIIQRSENLHCQRLIYRVGTSQTGCFQNRDYGPGPSTWFKLCVCFQTHKCLEVSHLTPSSNRIRRILGHAANQMH